MHIDFPGIGCSTIGQNGAQKKLPEGRTSGSQEKRTREKSSQGAALQIHYTLKELPHPQVLFTLGLLNLKPEPSMVSM